MGRAVRTRFLIIALNILTQIKNDKRTLGMILITPVMIMTIFGYAFAGEPQDLKVVIVDEDSGKVILNAQEGNFTFSVNFSHDVTNRFDKNIFQISYPSSYEEGERSVKEGRAWAFIYFSKNFSQHMVNRALLMRNQTTFTFGNMTLHLILKDLTIDEARINLIIDNSNSQVGSAIVREVNQAFVEAMQEAYPDISFSQSVNLDLVYGKNATYLDFLAPGVIGLVATMMTLMLTIVSLVRERTNGTLARLFASPTKSWEIVMGYTTAFSLISLGQSTILLLTAILLFNITILGNVFLALGMIVLYAIGIQGLGNLLSTIAKNEFQAVQLIPMIFVPFLLLGGIFWPVEAMPPFMRPISSVIPLTYLADGLRSIMIRGWGVSEVSINIIALLLFTSLMFLLSLAMMKRRARGR